MISSAKKTKITKSFVDALPLVQGSQMIYRDTELTGFAVRITGNKMYIAERKVNGQTVRVTIGKHGEITTAQARTKAMELLAQMAQGINPNQLKKEQRKAALAQYALKQPTLVEAYHAYITERTLKTSTLNDYALCIDDYLKEWKNIALIEITRKMVQDKHQQLSQRSKARANLAMRFLRALFNFSVEHYLDPQDKPIITTMNPVDTLTAKKSWNKIKRKKNYIRNEQLHDWVNAILSTTWLGQQNNNYHAYTNQDFLLMCLLTGLRRHELEVLVWSDIDLKYKTITIQDPKNGESLLLPIGDTLHYILKTRFERSAGNPYVFPARQGQGHVTNRSKARLRITEITGISFTFHDLRRTFSSIANGLNIGSYTIKRLINHTLDQKDVTDGYIQVSFAELRHAMNLIEGVILTDDLIHKIKQRTFEEKKGS